MRRLTVSIPEDLYERLQSAAAEEDRSVSYIVRLALREWASPEPKSKWARVLDGPKNGKWKNDYPEQDVDDLAASIGKSK